jgi:hypothetical protein
MVVEVLVAQGQGDDPLGDQGALVVDDQRRAAGVGDDLVEGTEQPDLLADLAEEQGAGIGGEPAALEVGDDRPGPRLEKDRGWRLQSVIAVASRREDGDRYNHIS